MLRGREKCNFGANRGREKDESYLQTLIICKHCFDENHDTFTLTLLIKIVMCSTFSLTNFVDYTCFDIKSSPTASSGHTRLYLET